VLVRKLVRELPFQRTKHGIAEKNGTPYLPEKPPNSNIIAAATVPNGNVTAPCYLKNGSVSVRATAGCNISTSRKRFSVDGPVQSATVGDPSVEG
jgi:hypothetical protein